MGICFSWFNKNKEPQNQEFQLRLLQKKIIASEHSQNDPRFTYYLPLFQQKQRLLILLNSSIRTTQKSQQADKNIENSPKKATSAQQELNLVRTYLKQFTSADSQLRNKMNSDTKTISTFVSNSSYQKEQFCMVKLQIQNINFIKDITHLGIAKKNNIDPKSLKKDSQLFLINRIKNQKVYRQFVFEMVQGSTLKFFTQPVASTLTIDISDLQKQEVICQVFTFQRGTQDIGYIALRMQFYSADSTFYKRKLETLTLLERQLQGLVSGNIDFERMSYMSQNSRRQSRMSESISQYPNEYYA